MFFAISKILYFLIQPLNWVVGLLLFSLLSKKTKRKKRCLQLGLFLILFFSNHFIYNLVIRAWEPDPVAIESLEVYDIGILAGGYSNFFKLYPENLHPFSKRANRLTQTLELYKAGKIKKILLTGGSGYLFGTEPSEANEAALFLERIGVPKADILIEPNSRNTFENAKNTKAVLGDSIQNQRLLLITSAFHMRRTKACFKKTGINCDTYCVDYIGERIRFAPESILFPDRQGFLHWEILIKEWFGCIAYWLRDYI